MEAVKGVSEILKRISEEKLGRDESDSKDSEIKLSMPELRELLREAYKSGHDKMQSQLHDSSLLFWQLMDSLPDYVYFKDRLSRFICINHSMSNYFELDHPDDAVGKSDFDFFEPKFAEEKFKDEQEIINNGQGWNFQEELDLKGDGEEKWVMSTKLPLHDTNGDIIGTFGISRDITDRKRVEIELERQRNLLDTIIQILPCRIFVRDTEGKFLLINEEYRRAFGLSTRLEAIGKKLTELRLNERSIHLADQDKIILETGKPIKNEIEYDQSLLGLKRWVLTSKVPYKSPRGNIEGIVGMTLDVTEQKEAELQVMKAHEAIKAQHQQFEAEILVARQLQEQLMSMGFDNQPMYSKSGSSWKLEASYLYSPSHHLAGDFFYLVPISENRLAVLVCDVMGHGVKAALVTMLIRGLVLESPRILGDPGKVLSQLNGHLVQLAEDKEFPRFVTAIYTVVDLDNGEVDIASAGHPAPLWSVHNSEKDCFEDCPIPSTGAALGLIGDELYESHTFHLDQLTELLFFTDGIIEQKMKTGEDFGADSLAKSAHAHEVEDLPDQLKAIQEDLSEATGTRSFSDDVCVMAVRIEPID